MSKVKFLDPIEYISGKLSAKTRTTYCHRTVSKRNFTQIREKRNLKEHPYTANEVAQHLRFKTVAAAVRQRINGPTREQDLAAYHTANFSGTFRQWLFQQELNAYDSADAE